MAVNPRAVAAALPRPTSAQATAGNGGFGSLPAQMAGAPMVASYGDWSYGRTPSLPRGWDVFQAGSFGPLSPLVPVPVDQPRDDDQRPEPRRWQYQVGWNLPHGVPGDEGIKLASFANLRTIADAYSVARSCIQVRKSELVGLEWDLVPTKAAEKAMRGNASARRDFETRRAKVVKFFRKPDPNYFNFASWFGALLEDVLAVDAMTLYLHPSRRPGRGVLGTDLAALDAIDGTTCRPLLDIRGGKPLPPNPAFQQYLYGVPRSDLMTILAEQDIADIGESMIREYRGDQLLYVPFVTRTWTPYGFPPVERALVPILSGLQRQQWQLDYYSQGSVPGLFISAGDPNATPQQLRELQDALNAMAGDPTWKHKIIVLPQGARIDPMRSTPLADQFDEIVMSQVCMAFDVMPLELGVSPRVSTTQSPGAANQMAKATEATQNRKANVPLLGHFSGVFNAIVQDVLRQADMRFLWEGLEEGEDEERLTGILVQQIGTGLASIDEARTKIGEQPWGLPLTSEPIMVNQTGIMPLSSIDPTTGQPKGLTDKLTATPQPAAAPAAPGGPEPGEPPASGDTGGTPAKPTPKLPAPAGGGGSTPAHAAAAAHTAAIAQPRPTQKTATPHRVVPGGGVQYTTIHPLPVRAALREIDLIRRRLTKGATITTWVPEHLPPHILHTLTTNTGPVAAAIDTARATVKATARAQRRDHAIEPARRTITTGLANLTTGLTNGTVSTAGFVDQAVAVLRDGIRQALTAGVGHALTDTTTSVAKQLSEEFLAWQRAFDARFDQYAQQAQQAYEAGYGATTLAQPGRWQIEWRATSAVPCDLCAARDGNRYTPGSVPGWPGSGGYGKLATVCRGGPNCHCELVYHRSPDTDDSGEVDTAGRLAGFAATLQSTVDAARAALGDEPAYLALLDQLADNQAATQRPYLEGLLQDLLTAAARTNAPDQPVTVPYTRAPDGGPGWLVPATVIAAELAALIAAQQAAQDQAAPATTSEPPNDTIAAATKHEGHADATHEVYAYLARHYPARVLEWVKTAHWHGPTTINLSDIDMGRRPGGARNPDKVRQIAHAVDDGMRLHPIVLVNPPGGGPYQIADGWHRTLALIHTGKRTVDAWVGDVTTTDGPWGETMNQAKLNKAARLDKDTVGYRDSTTLGRRCFTCSMYRVVDGLRGQCTLVAGIINPDAVCDRWEPDTASKAAVPVAAGLAVVAADTGRTLMLQRAITDGDPAAGTWEFPGGTLEPGEPPLAAARREWAEETGIPVPDGTYTGGWESTDGVYRGYVLLVPSEDSVPIHDGRDQVTNPDDPDGDQIEALAWWAPHQLLDNPAVRAELAQDLPTVLVALGQADRSKQAHAQALKLDEGKIGDYRARHLIRWYEHGEGAAEIGWGAPGDFDRCVAIAGEHMSPEQAKGFCNLRHHGALGIYPATHAAMEHGKK